MDRKSLGVVEAKKEGTLLSGVAEQSGHYGKNLPDFLAATVTSSLPFLYESTGAEFEMATEAATAKPIAELSITRMVKIYIQGKRGCMGLRC